MPQDKFSCRAPGGGIPTHQKSLGLKVLSTDRSHTLHNSNTTLLAISTQLITCLVGGLAGLNSFACVAGCLLDTFLSSIQGVNSLQWLSTFWLCLGCFSPHHPLSSKQSPVPQRCCTASGERVSLHDRAKRQQGRLSPVHVTSRSLQWQRGKMLKATSSERTSVVQTDNGLSRVVGSWCWISSPAHTPYLTRQEIPTLGAPAPLHFLQLGEPPTLPR